jgi:hypothetical protein
MWRVGSQAGSIQGTMWRSASAGVIPHILPRFFWGILCPIEVYLGVWTLWFTGIASVLCKMRLLGLWYRSQLSCPFNSRLHDNANQQLVDRGSVRLTRFPAICTARPNCHSPLLSSRTHSSSICAANVVLKASVKRVPDSWSGMPTSKWVMPSRHPAAHRPRSNATS